jgi:hypothetical protein
MRYQLAESGLEVIVADNRQIKAFLRSTVDRLDLRLYFDHRFNLLDKRSTKRQTSTSLLRGKLLSI